jgi:hypothetical protein
MIKIENLNIIITDDKINLDKIIKRLESILPKKENLFEKAKNKTNEMRLPSGSVVITKPYLRKLDFRRDNLKQLIKKLTSNNYVQYRVVIKNIIKDRISRGVYQRKQISDSLLKLIS